MTARVWPNGYISGWCLSSIVADHARCPVEHTADVDKSGCCHCPGCVAAAARATVPAVSADPVDVPEWAPDELVELLPVEPTADPAEAPPAAEPDASAGTRDEHGLAARVLELHCEAPRFSNLRPSCAHCGRAYPCPTAQLCQDAAA